MSEIHSLRLVYAVAKALADVRPDMPTRTELLFARLQTEVQRHEQAMGRAWSVLVPAPTTDAPR